MGRPPEAQVIYDARERRGLSQMSAAKTAGISDTYWRMVENGDRVLTGRRGVRTLARMADAAGVAPGQMGMAGRPDVEAALAALRMDRAASVEDAQAEAARMLEAARGLTAQQRVALGKRLSEIIREVRGES
jgi:transcriptional regulator with XRE-family HTH domain